MQIDPAILQAIMSGQSVPGYFSNRTYGHWENGGAEAGGNYIQPDGPETWTISLPMGNNMVAEWLGDGSFRGINQDTSKDWSNGATLVKAAILAAVGAAGADALGAGAAAGETGAAASDLSGMAGQRVAVGSMEGLGGGLGEAAVGGAGSQLGTTGANAMRAGELANYATNGALPSSAAQVGGNMSWLDWLNTAVNGTTGTRGLLDYATGNRGWLDAASTAANAANGNRRGTNWLGGLLGAAAGAASSRDGVQTQSTEPWGPAQPMLKSLMGDLDALRIQYRDEPVSPMLRGAYGNQASLIDAANVGSAGMLAGMQANASGQNSYSRQNKGRSLVGSNPVWNWQPGLLSPLVGG